MKRLIDLSNKCARAHFLKGSSYFNKGLPSYISFEPVLAGVAAVLKDGCYKGFMSRDPKNLSDVNYNFIGNKDGKFAWRPYELMHPVVYVSLVCTICEEGNWELIKERVKSFESGVVDCCSALVMSDDHQKDAAVQIRSWWHRVEQQSLIYSLKFSRLLHTDVTDCYGSLYTHSISWALHGREEAKKNKGKNCLLGNKIDSHIQAGRYGQTNGISQGSVLMDFVAELVLGYVDEQINEKINLKASNDIDVRILRYRDDYRIFANSDERAEEILKVVSDKLREVGMKLNVSKTFSYRNVVEGSIKPDKLAGIELQDLGEANAKTIQKQLLRLHSFGQRFPNSGALRRLVGEFHTNVFKQKNFQCDLEVQIAIATDIAFVSPATFPLVAAILSHLISFAPSKKKICLWKKVQKKMKHVPYNGDLEIWLQRVTKPKAVGIEFESDEPICKIVNGEAAQLWENCWISNDALKKALDVSKIVIVPADEAKEVVQPEEVELFKQNGGAYYSMEV